MIEAIAIREPRTTALSVPPEFTLIVVTNPFKPWESSSEAVQMHAAPLRLAEFLSVFGGRVAINNRLIARDEYPYALIFPGDVVAIAPIVHNKNILRTILLIAVAVVAAVSGVLIGGVLGALVATAISVGGSLLISVLLPMPKPAKADAPEFGWDGPQPKAQQGVPIQKLYGRMIDSGNTIASYNSTIGDKQYLNELIDFGLGPAKGITEIKINGNPIENYPGVVIEKRLGYAEQSPISFFGQVVNEFVSAARLRAGDAPTTFNGHQSDTQALEVEFQFPRGLWAGPDSNNRFDPWTVFIRVEYSLHGSGVWKPALRPRTTAPLGGGEAWVAVTNAQFSGGSADLVAVNTTAVAGEVTEGQREELDGVLTIYDESGVLVGTDNYPQDGTWTDPGGQQGGPIVTVTDWSNVAAVVERTKTSMVRHVTRIDNLPAGKYDVRVSKLGSAQHASGVPTTTHEDDTRRGEETWITAVREIAYKDLAYPGHILLGVRALATDKLSGGAIKITAVVESAETHAWGYKHAVAEDLPQLYFRFDDNYGDPCADSSGRGRAGVYGLGFTLLRPGLLTGSASKAILAPGTAAGQITFAALALAKTWGFECILKVTKAGWIASDGAGAGPSILDAAGGRFELGYTQGGIDHRSGLIFDAGQTVHVAVVRYGIAWINFVLDGTLAFLNIDPPDLTVNCAVTWLGADVDEFAIYAPPPQLSRFKLRSDISKSVRNLLEDYSSDNRAMVAWDILTNKRYGVGHDPSPAMVYAWKRWADFCDEVVDDGFGGDEFRHTYGGVFNQWTSALDALGQVAQFARALPLQVGDQFTVVIDEATDASALFNAANIKEGSFERFWLSLEDRANVVDVKYMNLETGQPEVVTINDIQPGEDYLPAAMIDASTAGVTSAGEAWRYGKFFLRANRLIKAGARWKVDVEALTCRVGDRVDVQMPIPKWGVGGRLAAAADTTHVTLDRAVTLAAGVQYYLSINFPKLLRATSTIASIAGSFVELNGYAGQRVTRLVAGAAYDVDVKVLAYGSTWVQVASTVGLAAGQNFKAYGTDVTETKSVQINAGPGAVTTAALVMSAAFTQLPEVDHFFAFGIVNNDKRPLRVTKIERTADFEFSINALDYDEDCYIGDPPTLNAPDVAGPNVHAAVGDLTLNEQFLPGPAGGVYQPTLTIGFRPGRATAKARIFVKLNGEPEYLLEDTAAAFYVKQMAVKAGDVVTVRVVGRDLHDNEGVAASATMTIVGEGLLAADVTGFRFLDCNAGPPAKYWIQMDRPDALPYLQAGNWFYDANGGDGSMGVVGGHELLLTRGSVAVWGRAYQQVTLKAGRYRLNASTSPVVRMRVGLSTTYATDAPDLGYVKWSDEQFDKQLYVDVPADGNYYLMVLLSGGGWSSYVTWTVSSISVGASALLVRLSKDPNNAEWNDPGEELVLSPTTLVDIDADTVKYNLFSIGPTTDLFQPLSVKAKLAFYGAAGAISWESHAMARIWNVVTPTTGNSGGRFVITS